jgi:hypothetical protein
VCAEDQEDPRRSARLGRRGAVVRQKVWFYYSIYLLYWSKAHKLTPEELRVSLLAKAQEENRTHFTCFAGAKVQLLVQKYNY